MFDMSITAHTLDSIALVVQLGGAWLVIGEVRAARTNMAQLQADLEDADAKMEKHIEDMAHIGEPESTLDASNGLSALERFSTSLYPPRPIVRLPLETRTALANQLGPGAADQRTAILRYVTDSNTKTDGRAWLGVGLVIVGVVVSYIATWF